MPPEVMDAMAEANRFFVTMRDLHEAAGRRIAEIVGAEDALVSSGAFAALLVGAAGVLTGTDEERMAALPRPTWPKVECLFQTAHRFFYDRVFQYAGMTLVEADTRQAYEEAITDRTALLVGLSFRGTAEHGAGRRFPQSTGSRRRPRRSCPRRSSKSAGGRACRS